MKGLKKYMAGILVAGMVLGSAAVPAPVYATEAEDAQEDNGDDVEITLDDKPYLALGADLTADQQHTVLSYMGIEAADFDKYDVVYVSNAEEHQYLDSYVPKKQIGTKALSSVLVSLADSGNGLKVSTYNINYCTAGMYKNALATAGVEDANVIVAGPFPLSGTAALVGTFEAYEKLTGKELDESVVDAAMDELVTTGDLEQSIDGDSNDVEAMIADLKGQIASGKIKTPEEIEQAIEKLADKYDLKLSDDDKQKLLGLMKKLQGLDLNWDSIKNQASAWASQLQNQLADKNIGQKIAAFFEKLFENFKYFLDGIIPTCEEVGVKMACHPDDPGWPIFGLPRITHDQAGFDRMVKLHDSPCNTLCLCTGSLGSNVQNDIPATVRHFGEMNRIGCLHVRNIKHLGSDRRFRESSHLSSDGDLDMYEIMKAAYETCPDTYIRPDHGRMIWDEIGRPGYGLYDRALGIAYLNGLWEAIDKNAKRG